MAKPEQSAERQTPTERRGVGQSGYTAGRTRDDDAAIDHTVDTRNVAHPASEDDGLGTDDRFTGRGGTVRRDDGIEDDDGDGKRAGVDIERDDAALDDRVTDDER